MEKFKIFIEIASVIGIPIVSLIVTYRISVQALGVQKTNFITGLQDQEKHKRDSREFELKREVFLNAVDAVAASIQFISTLPNLDIAKAEARFHELSLNTSLARLSLVASKETLEQIYKFQSLFARYVVTLFFEKIKMQTLTDSINEILSDPNNHESIDSLLLEKERERKRLIELSHSYIRELGPAASYTNFYARKELGLDFDEEEFIRILSQSQKSVDEVMKESMSKLDDLQKDLLS